MSVFDKFSSATDRRWARCPFSSLTHTYFSSIVKLALRLREKKPIPRVPGAFPTLKTYHMKALFVDVF